MAEKIVKEQVKKQESKQVKRKTKKKLKLRNNVYVYLSLIALVVLVVLLFNCGKSLFKSKSDDVNVEEKPEIKEEQTPVVEETELSLIMVGDCLIHGSIYLDARKSDGSYDFYKMIDLVKPIISSYDLAFYNQESILGGTNLGLSSYPRFNSPKEVGDAFLDAGFNLVSLANNHTLDMGEKGILSSLDYWDEKEKTGIITAGSYSSFEDRDKVVIGEKNGITYALLSYTTTTNGLNRPKGKEYLVNVYDADQVKKDIERVRDKVDLLMVAMHWGEEYTHTPTSEQEEIAKYLASLNVDIIIGHHPHVIQPIDFIGKTMVIYSLGNFIASQGTYEARHIGLMASVKVHKKTVDGVSEITLVDPTADLEYMYSIRSGENSAYGYELYPFDQLNDKLLKNYKSIYDKYMSIVTKRSDKILFKTL